jgi:hypothetical protein
MATQLTLLASTLLLAVTAALGTIWMARLRASRRLHAAADAYAEREIAREARWRAAYVAVADRRLKV